MDPAQVERISEKDMRVCYPRTIGHRFSLVSKVDMHPVAVAVTMQKTMLHFARQGDCVIVGQCADVALKELGPFNIFVYADMASKLARCTDRAAEDEKLSLADLRRKIVKVDKDRAAYRALFSETEWGRKEAYHLCVNTTGKEVKTLVPAIAEYVRLWFRDAR